MPTAIDTNVIVSLWDVDDSLNEAANGVLADAVSRGEIVVCGAVYAELLAFPGRTQAFLNKFINDAGIRVDWEIGEAIWQAAGKGFALYAKKRRRQAAGPPRRILADFIIGAHALENGFRLVTLDKRTYKTAFPKLRVIGI